MGLRGPIDPAEEVPRGPFGEGTAGKRDNGQQHRVDHFEDRVRKAMAQRMAVFR